MCDGSKSIRPGPAKTQAGRQMNLVHGSKGSEAAEREIALCFRDEEVCAYNPTITRLLRAADET
jgi:hypothetical protein